MDALVWREPLRAAFAEQARQRACVVIAAPDWDSGAALFNAVFANILPFQSGELEAKQPRHQGIDRDDCNSS